MGMWDEYCTVCGVPTYADFVDYDEVEPLPPPAPNPADYTWLESFIGISNKEEVIPLGPYDYYGSFDILQPDTSPYSYFAIGFRNVDVVDEKAARGYACHVTCYNLLQQELHYTLKYADVLPLVDDLVNNCDCNKFPWSDYGGLGEYQEQGFGHLQLVKDGKLWMIEDPSKNAQNKERILQLWRPLLESGFKKPEAKVGDGRSATEVAELNVENAELDMDESKA